MRMRNVCTCAYTCAQLDMFVMARRTLGNANLLCSLLEAPEESPLFTKVLLVQPSLITVSLVLQ